MRHITSVILILLYSVMAYTQPIKSYVFIDGKPQQPMDSTAKQCRVEVNRNNDLRQQFRHWNDSLFAAGNYAAVINNCERHGAGILADDANYYLVAAYDALGIVPMHDSVLRRALNFMDTSFSTLSAISLMASSGTNSALLAYLNRQGRREKVEQLVIAQYEKVVRPGNKRLARTLWHLLLNDQYIRGWHSSGQLSDSAFMILNTANLNAQYALYHKTGHVFSKEEAGPGLNYEQFLLLAHEADWDRREWYLQLIKAGAASGRCPLRRIPDFILRTEMNRKGTRQFFMDLETREEAIRKEYHLPDYYFSIN